MKKTLITTATALTLLAAPLMNKADAATLQNDSNKSIKIQQYQYKVNNMEDAQKVINQLLAKYNVNGNTTSKNVEKKAAQSNHSTTKKTTEKTKPVKQKKPTVTQNKPSTGQTSKTTPEKSTTPTTSATTKTNYSLNAFEKQVVDLTNKERAKNGLPALKIDNELSKVARTKSNDMAKNKYFDHTSPTYGSPFDMMKKFGISYRSAGENIAMGQRSPEEVVNAWMNSEGHRANILNKNYTHIGVGYVENGNYWTQEFIGK
ncbi:CAP domain-containing protein [Heyndrickxia vini]|uniref:Serine protease n=1 Tax=Heyndrickxia vini TaxID=1476025 RepID=A0ABX7E733_9BACI|nr:CAP domain-containing protein [Heyndrickxia vini]QQZ11120.1 serine protease [Heyndrickxia vini]